MWHSIGAIYVTSVCDVQYQSKVWTPSNSMVCGFLLLNRHVMSYSNDELYLFT